MNPFIRTVVFALLATFPCVRAEEPIKVPAEPVALENGVSPDKQYDVVLEADTYSSTYPRWAEGNKPKFFIRKLPEKKIVATVEWEAEENPNRLLHEHSGIRWRADGKAVVINTSERNYSHTQVFVLDPKNVTFREVEFPSYKKMTGFPHPNWDDLKARGFDSSEWNKDGLLVHKMIRLQRPSYQGNDPLRHRTTLRVTLEKMEVVSRQPLAQE